MYEQYPWTVTLKREEEKREKRKREKIQQSPMYLYAQNIAKLEHLVHGTFCL